jgi:DNA-binding MarR family transcriptional regulator
VNVPAESAESAGGRKRSRRVNPPSMLYLIKQLELAVTAEMERVISIAGLTPIQYTALTAMERHPGITSAQLARNSFVRAQSMAELVNGLLRRGLITRERDPGDGRHYLLSLTPQGAALVESLSGPVGTVERLMLSELAPEEVVSLHGYLDRCRRSLTGRGAPSTGRPRRAERPAAI